MENKLCIQCSKTVLEGEDFCWECIIDDAITMGVIQNDIHSKQRLI